MSGPSFGGPSNQAGINSTIAAVADKMTMSATGELTPRQKLLNLRWSYYRREEYAGRAVDWNGHKCVDPIQRDSISMQGYLPPGFEDHGATLPLEFRRPSVPLGLVRIVVSRFTGLLFSDKRHPTMTVPGDQDTEDYLGALLKYGRFWSNMQKARNYGGGMGSVGIGFKFIDGKITFECFDPRWTTPEWVDCSKHELESVEVRYVYEKRVRTRDGGAVSKKFWYRRWIDAQTDTIWEKVPVEDEEPRWNEIPAESSEHNLGFVPVEWIQNIPVDDAIDGDPDCQGGYELSEAIDCQLSQAHRGTLNNCFGAETEIVTDRGVKQLSDFEIGTTVTALTHTGAWTEATVVSGGVKQLFAVTIQRGTRGRPTTLRATADHRWLLEDGSSTRQLSVGDRLMPAANKFSDFEYETATKEERDYWCRGFVWGDGWVERRDGDIYGSKVRLCGKKIVYTTRFQENEFRVSFPPSAEGDAFAVTSKFVKGLPDIDMLPTNLLRAFVRGYVDADGSKSNNKKSTRWRCIQSTGEEGVAFIRRAFPAVGLYIAGEQDLTHEMNGYGPYTAKTVRFSLNENSSNHCNTGWRVRAIEPLGEDEVRCLKVEGDESFTLPCGVVTGNSDPTVFISSDDDLPALSKGSDHALKMGAGSSAQYMEMNGQGATIAKTLSEMFEDRFYRLVQCVPESIMFANSSDKTATEIEREFSSMLEKADVIRGQYGPAIEGLCQKIIAAIRMMAEPVESIDEFGVKRATSKSIYLPPRVVKEQVDDGTGTGEMMEQTVEKPYELGNGHLAVARWGRYFPPSLNDIETATRTAQSAHDATLMDKEAAVRWLMPFYELDSSRVLEALQAEADKQAADDAAAAAPEDTGPPPQSYSPAEIQNGLVTINEVRAGKGLGAIPDGDLTVPQYKAKNPELFVAATASESTQAVDALFAESGAAPKPGFGQPASTSPAVGVPPQSNKSLATSNPVS